MKESVNKKNMSTKTIFIDTPLPIRLVGTTSKRVYATNGISGIRTTRKFVDKFGNKWSEDSKEWVNSRNR
jgi:hypothetical protein